MGAFDENVKEFLDEEKPGHLVRLSSFYLQETEVTFGEFDRFCKETQRDRNDADLKDGFYYAWDASCKKMSEDELRGHPAVGVTRSWPRPTPATWAVSCRRRRNGNSPPALGVGINSTSGAMARCPTW